MSAAVMRALEGDKAYRFNTAAALSDGLQRGLRGEDVTLQMDEEPVTPPEFPQAETATRPLERTARTAHRPAPPPPRYTLPQTAPRPRQKRSFIRSFFRFVLGALALVLIAAVVAGSVILLTDRAASVKIKDWAGNSVEKLSDELKQQVRDNTQ
ncbi:MAG: hypothetical protein KDB64_05760 [Solirubrobacterales bacterium]|nr:hypothetical protein [Solirubrobacterales bacterium]